MMSNLYKSMTNLQRQNQEEKISFVVASKTYKYLGIHLIKKMKDLYNENNLRH